MNRRFSVSAVYLLVVLLAAGFACRDEDPAVINKLDPALKKQVEDLQGTMMSIILRTEGELSADQTSRLEEHGVVFQAHTETVYVCRIPLKSVLPVARESFVQRLEAPKELKPF